MRTGYSVVALECLLDLGVTVVYAAIAGLLIIGIVASDGGGSIASACLCALLLPLAVLALIGTEVAFRIFQEWRETRRERGLFPTAGRGNGAPLGFSRCR